MHAAGGLRRRRRPRAHGHSGRVPVGWWLSGAVTAYPRREIVSISTHSISAPSIRGPSAPIGSLAGFGVGDDARKEPGEDKAVEGCHAQPVDPAQQAPGPELGGLDDARSGGVEG